MATDMQNLNIEADNGSFSFAVVDQTARDAASTAQRAAEAAKGSVHDWAKKELFDKADLPTDTQSFITVDGVEYYRYHAGATYGFTWNNPHPMPGAVTITARGVSQYGGTNGTRLKTVYDDGTYGPDLYIVVSGESRTVTVTTDASKTLAKITGNYDMENWVLLDMSVMSIQAEYSTGLPIADANAAGGVLADPAEDSDTQPVRIRDGKLYTAPGGGEGGSVPITYVESLDEANLANLRDLETGPYVLYGYFLPFPGAADTLTCDNTLASVAHLSAGSHVLVFNPLNCKVNFLEILVDETADSGFTYSVQIIDMRDLPALIEAVGSRDNLATEDKTSIVAAINELTATSGEEGTPGEVTIQPPTYAATVEEMTDTSKVYIGANGNLWAYQTGGTSVVTTRENIDGLIDDSRLGSDGSTATDATAYAGYVATDYIDLLQYSIPFQLHIDGGVFLPAAADSYTRMGTYTADKTKITVLQPIQGGIDQILNVPDSDVTVDDNNNLTITFNQTPTTNNANNDGVLQYVRFSGKGEPDTVSVYITFESEVSGDGWVDTGIKYSPSLTDAEKTEIAEEAAGLIDTELLGVIGDGTVTV